VKILINLQVGSVRVNETSRHPLLDSKAVSAQVYLETIEVVDPVLFRGVVRPRIDFQLGTNAADSNVETGKEVHLANTSVAVQKALIDQDCDSRCQRAAQRKLARVRRETGRFDDFHHIGHVIDPTFAQFDAQACGGKAADSRIAMANNAPSGDGSTALIPRAMRRLPVTRRTTESLSTTHHRCS
jgi:hypothetical protein